MKRAITMAHEQCRILVTRSRDCIPIEAAEILEKQFKVIISIIIDRINKFLIINITLHLVLDNKMNPVYLN